MVWCLRNVGSMKIFLCWYISSTLQGRSAILTRLFSRVKESQDTRIISPTSCGKWLDILALRWAMVLLLATVSIMSCLSGDRISTSSSSFWATKVSLSLEANFLSLLSRSTLLLAAIWSMFEGVSSTLSPLCASERRKESVRILRGVKPNQVSQSLRTTSSIILEGRRLLSKGLPMVASWRSWRLLLSMAAVLPPGQLNITCVWAGDSCWSADLFFLAYTGCGSKEQFWASSRETAGRRLW